MMTSAAEGEENESGLFLVLDGGGARGIAHIAMWRFLERRIAIGPHADQPDLPDWYGESRYRLAGIAGTSAGALAASFIAAGGSASDFIDENGRPPLCTPLGLRSFHDLFGIRGWRRLQELRFAITPPSVLKSAIEKFERDIALERVASESGPTERRDDKGGPLADGENTERDHPAQSASPIDLAEDAVAEPISKPYLIDASQWFVLLAAVSPFLFKFAKYVASLQWSPPYSLLLLLFSMHLAASGVSQIARKIERRRTANRQRYYGKFLRMLLHPAIAMLYAIAIATFVSVFLDSVFQFAREFGNTIGVTDFLPDFAGWSIPIPQRLRYHYPDLPGRYPVISLLDYAFWSLGFIAFGLACGATILQLLRDFIKGGIDTDIIERDLNTALRVLLTHRCSGWDEQARRHIWEPRQGLSFRQQAILEDEKHVVTFDDLFDATQIHLTVVAADTIKNCVCTYNSNTHRQMSVAKAVSASMSIPFAFQFVRERSRILVDGGLVSSIPAWVFRRHRNRDPDCRILAVRIEPGRYDDWIPRFLDYRKKAIGHLQSARASRVAKAGIIRRYPSLSFYWPFGVFFNILNTALYGARALELDASDRLDSVALVPVIGLLDFDADRKAISRECSRLEENASKLIEDCLWLRQNEFNALCRQIENEFRGEGTPRHQPDGLLRIFWAERDGMADSIRIKRTYGFLKKEHFDDRIVMPFRTSMSALAFETRTTQFAERAHLRDLRADFMNRYRNEVRWPDLRWCWAIPVCRIDDEDGELAGVLAIECDEPLRRFDIGISDEAAQLASRWPTLPVTGRVRSRQDAYERQQMYFNVASDSGSIQRARMNIWESRFKRIMREHLIRQVRNNGYDLYD